MRIVVYSANIGNYDTFKDPEPVDPNVRYVLFTDDRSVRSTAWEVRDVDFLGHIDENPGKVRYLKTHPRLVLPEHDVSVWLDHKFGLRVPDVGAMLSELGFDAHDVMMFRHASRDCTYAEARTVRKWALEARSIVRSQVRFLKQEGFPRGHGLFDAGFVVRRNIPSVNEFNELWWEMISRFSGRDQLSLMYCAWKCRLPIGPVPGSHSIVDNPFLTRPEEHLGRALRGPVSGWRRWRWQLAARLRQVW